MSVGLQNIWFGYLRLTPCWNGEMREKECTFQGLLKNCQLDASPVRNWLLLLWVQLENWHTHKEKPPLGFEETKGNKLYQTVHQSPHRKVVISVYLGTYYRAARGQKIHLASANSFPVRTQQKSHLWNWCLEPGLDVFDSLIFMSFILCLSSLLLILEEVSSSAGSQAITTGYEYPVPAGRTGNFINGKIKIGRNY